jgi:dihydroorotate dehydrogenase electron transfer subunit
MAAPIDVTASVLRNTPLSCDYHVVVLDAPAIAAAAQPGQFVMVRTTAGTDPLLRRPFSVFEILRRPDGAPYALSLLIKRVGPGSTRLCDADTGDRYDCLGPLGTPFEVVSPPSEAWMVAGGVGLAPFATLAESLQSRGTTAVLFYGARGEHDLFYREWFLSRGVRVDIATEDGSAGMRGRVTSPLGLALEHASRDRHIMIYACGPEPMLRAVATLAQAHDRPVQVSMERLMGCGLGGCYSCVVKVHGNGEPDHFVRSCLHGPVFDGRDIVWE